MSAAQCATLTEVFLCWSAVGSGVWGERGYSDGSTPCALPPWPPSFPLGAFPMWISFLPSPQLSPQSQQQFLAWYCSPIPTLHLPATMHSRGLASLYGVQRAVVRIICVVLTTFRLSQISCFTLRQPQMLPFCPKQLPWIWGSHPCFSSPTIWLQAVLLILLLFFPSYLHPTKFCMSLYIPFQWPVTPASTQLVLYEVFCIWRYSHDASLERDVLHIHLLLWHLVFSELL